MIKKIEYNTLKNRIVRAIRKGNHETRYIIEAVKCELQYYDFCKAIAELRCKGIVGYREDLNEYYLIEQQQ